MAGMPTNVIGATGIRVARCDFDGDFNHPEARANARLIAAAPELLGVVSDFIDWFDNPAKAQDVSEHVEKMRAAVAKATTV